MKKKDVDCVHAMWKRHKINQAHHGFRNPVKRYPQLLHAPVEPHVPPQFVQCINDAVSKVKFNNRQLFPKEFAAWFELTKKKGLIEAGRIIMDSTDPRKFWEFRCGLNAVLRMAISSKLSIATDAYLPYCDYDLHPVQDVYVEFDALRQTKTEFGTLYYTKHEPKIRIRGRDYIVGFSKHSLDRLESRGSVRPDTYQAAHTIYQIISQHIHYQVSSDAGDQVNVTLFDPCFKSSISGWIGLQIMGSSIHAETTFFRVSGYAVLKLNDPFAAAVTFLTPGMRGTPERDAVEVGALNRETKSRYLRLMEQGLVASKLWDQQYLDILKWVHKNGVPQVVDLKDQGYGPSPLVEKYTNMAIKVHSGQM